MNDGSQADAEILGPQRGAMIEQTATQLGIVCTVCQGDMEEGGYEFVSIAAKMKEGRPTAIVNRAFVCNRPECEDAREGLRRRSTAYRVAPGWKMVQLTEGEAQAAQSDVDREQEDGAR